MSVEDRVGTPESHLGLARFVYLHRIGVLSFFAAQSNHTDLFSRLGQSGPHRRVRHPGLSQPFSSPFELAKWVSDEMAKDSAAADHLSRGAGSCGGDFHRRDG